MKKSTMAAAVCAIVSFCTLLSPAAAQTSGIQTNAQGGVFSSDRRFWFAVPEGQRLRLLVNGNETYRGPGPASSTFSVRAGEDKSYELTAERRSPPPQDEVLESRSFIVRIDAVNPAPVKVSGNQGSGYASPWTLIFSAEPGSIARAVVDADSYLTSYDDIQGPLVFSARRVEGLAWSVDAAGNPSTPVPFSFKPFSLTVANPAPGRWVNTQRLVVASAGAAEVYWSDDGSDPFGPAGKPYRESVLIEKTGPVVVRVAAKSPDGRVERREVAFEVAGRDDPVLGSLRAAESKPILFEKKIAVPTGFRWDIGAEGGSSSADLSFAGGADVVLRPIDGIGRFVPFYASSGTGVHRFMFALGADKAEPPAIPAAATPADSIPSAPSSYSAGRARAVAWARRQGNIRYRWIGDEEWKDGVGPVSVAAEGGVLEWLVDKGTAVDGPFSKNFPAMALEAAFPSSVPAASVLNSSVSPGAVDLTPPKNVEGVRFSLSAPTLGLDPRTVELSRGSSVRLDVCDGEQFSWTASGDGASVSFRIDRRRPAPPRIFAPEEGSWTHSVPDVSFIADEGRVEATARWRDEEGRTGEYPLAVSSKLRSLRTGVVEYTVEAKTADIAGNVSAAVVRRFTVDESTAYASGSADPRKADGSRAFPFTTLNEALVFARSAGRSRVWISGTIEMSGAGELFDGLSVEGGYDAAWKRDGGKASVVLSPGASLEANSGNARLASVRIVESGSRSRPLLSVSGAALELNGVAVVPRAAERPRPPVLSLRSNARVAARDCLLIGGSPAVDVFSSKLSLTECLVSGSTGPEGRALSLRAEDSALRFESSRFDTGKAEASSAVVVDARGGSSTFIRSVVDSAATGSAIGVSAKDSALEFLESDIAAAADGYSSAVAAEGGSVSFLKGSLGARARDAAVLILNDAKSSSLEALRFSVGGTGVVRAVQIRGAFPSIASCRFSAERGSGASEVFAGDPPAAGSVRGNQFSGFAFLYDQTFPADDLPSFNRRFAGNGPMNAIIETDGNR